MVAYIFDRVLQRGMQAGVTPSVKRESRDWFRQQTKNLSVSSQRMVRSDRSRLTDRPLLGRMYLFQYDPKGKKTLPYYDRFPLVFPIVLKEL